MEYVIALLEEKKNYLERDIRDKNLMQLNMNKATDHMHQVGQIKRAIKILKLKIKK